MPPYIAQRPDFPLITGWPSEAPAIISQNNKEKILDWSFLGQVTHVRREQCVAALETMPNGHLLKTPGFTQGVDRNTYYELLAMSKMVPCPSGPCTPDSLRFAEALEAGAIPIADNLTPNPLYPPGYWNYTLREKDLPFPIIEDWSTLPEVMAEWLDGWEKKAAECQRWWRYTKSYWIERMREDLAR
jgi:hypothetical protein